MKTPIVILVFLIFASPVFAQQADVAETYTDIGIPFVGEGIGRHTGFDGIFGAGVFTAKRIFGDNHRLITIAPGWRSAKAP